MITKYKDLSIGRYADLQETFADDSLDEVTRNATLLSILTDIYVDDLVMLPLDEYEKLASKMGFIYEPMPEPDAHKAKKIYDIGDWQVVPCPSIQKMLVVQYTDFQTYLQDYENHKVELLSCMLVPKGLRYGEGYDVLEVQDAIRDNLSIVDAQNLLAFFLLLTIKSVRVFLRSCILAQKMDRRMDRKEREETIRKLTNLLNSFGNGDGLTRYMRFPSATVVHGTGQTK